MSDHRRAAGPLYSRTFPYPGPRKCERRNVRGWSQPRQRLRPDFKRRDLLLVECNRTVLSRFDRVCGRTRHQHDKVLVRLCDEKGIIDHYRFPRVIVIR